MGGEEAKRAAAVVSKMAAQEKLIYEGAKKRLVKLGLKTRNGRARKIAAENAPPKQPNKPLNKRHDVNRKNYLM